VVDGETLASGSPEQVDRILAEMATGDRAILDAYVTGLNAGLSAERSLAACFAFGGLRPWTAEDTVAISLYFSRLMSFEYAALSNSWHLRGRDGQGKAATLMAADPHLLVETIPGRFYAAHLDISDPGAGRRELVVVGVPGLPIFCFAAGNRVAWSMTALQVQSRWRESGVLARTGQVWHWRAPDGSLETYGAGEVRLDAVKALVWLPGQAVPWRITLSGKEIWHCESIDWLGLHASGAGFGRLVSLPLVDSAGALAKAAGSWAGLSVLWLASDSSGGLAMQAGIPLNGRAGAGKAGPFLDMSALGRMANCNDWPGFDLETLPPMVSDTERKKRLDQLMAAEPDPGLDDVVAWQLDRQDSTLAAYARLLNAAADDVVRHPPSGREKFHQQNTDPLVWKGILEQAKTWKPVEGDAVADPVAEAGMVEFCRSFAKILSWEAKGKMPRGASWLAWWEARTDDDFFDWRLAGKSDRARTALLMALSGRQTSEGPEITWRPLPLPNLPGVSAASMARSAPSHGRSPWALSVRGDNQHAAVLRLAGEVAQGGRVRIVLPAGQSGNPASPHYDDFLEDWSQGTMHEIRLGQTPALGNGWKLTPVP
jgi:hypothetical protein